MSREKVFRNTVIGKAGGRNLEADLYIPQKKAQKQPALVIIHGGGWRNAAKKGDG